MAGTYVLRKGVSTLSDLADGGMALLAGLKGAGGTVWYVDSTHPNTSDSNWGDDPNKPLTTYTKAYARCTDGVGDVIYISGLARYREAELEIQKDAVRIIGAGWGTQLNQNASATKYCLRVNAQNVIIANLQISVNDQGGGIFIGDTGTGDTGYNACATTVENCFIRGDWYTAGGSGASVTEGVKIAGATIVQIRNNYIWGWATGVYVQDGSERTSYGANISDNYILYCKTYGIYWTGIGYPSVIKGNYIADMTTSAPLTRAISLNVSTGNILVANNYIGAANANYDSGDLNIWVGNKVEVTATASEVRAVTMETY